MATLSPQGQAVGPLMVSRRCISTSLLAAGLSTDKLDRQPLAVLQIVEVVTP